MDEYVFSVYLPQSPFLEFVLIFLAAWVVISIIAKLISLIPA